MRSRPCLILVIVMLSMCVGSMAFAQQTEDAQPVQVLTSGLKLTIVQNGETTDAFALSPFSPLVLSAKGPGVLTLRLHLDVSADPAKAAGQKASFQIYKNDALFDTIELEAKKSADLTYQGRTDVSPSVPREVNFDVPDGEEWKIGVLLAPLGGSASFAFEPPEDEEAGMLPLVPLVPLVAPTPAPAPAPAETVPTPPEEATPVAEEVVPTEEPVAAELPPPVDEMPAPAEETPVEETPVAAAEDTPAEDDGTIYVMLEPRLGVNLAFQSVKTQTDLGNGQALQKTEFQTDPMFTVGFSAKYVLPFLDQRFRIGFGFDWHQYSYTKTTDTVNHIELMSVPMMAEFDAFILTKGLVRPFVGMGVGANYVTMKYRGEVNDQRLNTNIAEVTDKQVTYAIAFWAGTQFHVWHGGPFIKANYLISYYDHPYVSMANHGGLSFLVGYQFEL